MTRGEFALSAVIAGLVMAVAANQEAPREGAAPAYVDASPAALAQAAPTPGPPEHTAPAPRWPEDGGADAEVEADPVAAPQPSPIVDVFVEVSPSTVQPGFLVGIKASCHDNSVPAIVASDAFGRVQVQPQRGCSPPRRWCGSASVRATTGSSSSAGTARPRRRCCRW